MILHHNCAEKFILLKFEAQRIIRPIASPGKVSLSSLIHRFQRTGAKASSAGREYELISTSVRRVAVAAHQHHFAGRWACGDAGARRRGLAQGGWQWGSALGVGAGGRCRGSGMGVGNGGGDVLCCIEEGHMSSSETKPQPRRDGCRRDGVHHSPARVGFLTH